MSLISADSSRDFLTLGSHVFSSGLSHAASGYIYDSPANSPPPPPHIDNLDPTICWYNLQQTLSRFHQGGLSRGIRPSRHGLQTLNAGALISSVAVKEHERSPSPPGWECVGDYRNEKIDANFFVSNSTWAAYRPRRYWEWDEDWKEEG